jgi:sporulation protein YlmC with PRC-barrel domain
MLQLCGALSNKAVLSLRTGGPVAVVGAPIIDPNNLKIEGFYCQDTMDKSILVLLYQDIRDLLPDGFVVDDHDVLAVPSELVRLKKIMDMNFQLIGKQVETVSGEKIGKVNDFAVEVETMFVQKVYVAQSILKSFTGGSLSVDRSQIQEITNRRVIISDPLRGMPAAATS